MLIYILYCIWIFSFGFFPIYAVPFNTQNLTPVYKLQKLVGIQNLIEFPEEYEKPFLKGFPQDLPFALLKSKNATGPHCFEPFRQPDPWYNIHYPRMPYIAILRDWYIDPSLRTCGAIFNDKQKLLLKYNKYLVFEDLSNVANKDVVHIEKAVHLLQKCTEGYYHFVIEAIPRLLLAKDILKQDSSIKILFMCPAKNFMFQFFDLLGIDKSRIMFCDPNTIYHVDTLYFPKPPYMGYPSQEELARARNALLMAVKTEDDLDTGEAPEEKRDLIIVIERLEKKRHVTNTMELVERIKQEFPSLQDKIVIFYGNISVEEQINLFKRARIIIGPHGAGFTNMLFACPGTVNIEFIPEKFLSILYWHVASALGMSHNHVLVPGASWGSQFSVSIDKVIKILKRYV